MRMSPSPLDLVEQVARIATDSIFCSFGHPPGIGSSRATSHQGNSNPFRCVVSGGVSY